MRLSALLISIVLLASCSAPAVPAPSATKDGGQVQTGTAVTPAAAETPAPQAEETAPPEATTETIRVAFMAAFKAELDVYTFSPMDTMSDIIGQKGAFMGIHDDLPQYITEAFQKVCGDYGVTPGAVTSTLPGWKLIAAAVSRLGDGVSAFLAQTGGVRVEASGNVYTLDVDLTDVRQMLSGLDEIGAYGVAHIYAYMNTIYDDDGNETRYVHYSAFPAGYIESLGDPLPGETIKDGWYNDRDSGERKHTGTDIRAEEDTEILSCTDGVVLSVSYNEGAGNYVVVLDDAGFEYHYYHMVRLTDFLHVGDRVAKGDVVGHVGNTGNSDANHLHLGIISPAFTYINPYYVLRDMRAAQKRASAG